MSMRHFRDEADFQRWAMRLISTAGHVQDHRYAITDGVPDLSAALYGTDLWLEAKFGRFNMAGGPDGRDYDRFLFKETNRLQLEWLIKRRLAGSTQCGILGYMEILPTRLTHYLFYLDAEVYLDQVYKKEISVGAILLMDCCVDIELVKTATDLYRFIRGLEGRMGRAAIGTGK